MHVENLAVSRVVTMISRCPRLSAQVTTNDKTPFTDGHVDVYSGLGRSKKDWHGRVSVQVKGRTHRGKLKFFPISRTDLLGFQNDSGVLYFVVTVDKSGKTTPYYALLAPFRIQALLSATAEDQKTVAVPVERSPSLPDSIERIFGLALQTKRQNPSMGFDPSVFEQVRSVTVHSIAEMSFDTPVVLDASRGDYALEVTTAGGMSLPLGGTLEICPVEYVQKKAKVAIRCSDVFFDECLARRVDDRGFEIVLAGGLTMVLTETGGHRTGSFNLALESNFAERLKAVRFFVALSERHPIWVGENAAEFAAAELDQSGVTDLDSLVDQLQMLERLQELWDLLDVDPTIIELDDVNGDQIRELLNLRHALVSREEVTEGETGRFVVPVGRWLVMVLMLPGSSPGRWKYVDPFDPAAPHMYRYSADLPRRPGVPITVYDAVEDEYLSTLVNLRLDRIVDAYEGLADQPDTPQLANQRILALVRAADAQPDRATALLDAAMRLNDWVIGQEGDLDRHVLNRAQIRHRTGTLSALDRDEVRAMKRRWSRSTADESVEFELACALVLDDREESKFLASQLTPEQRAMMETWPIWQLQATEDAGTPQAS